MSRPSTDYPAMRAQIRDDVEPQENDGFVGRQEEHKPEITGKSYVLLVIILGSLSALGPLAIDMYLPSFKAIATDFNTDLARVEWTLATYFIGLSLGQLFYGPIADRYGRKLPLYTGLLTFALTSAACTFAVGVESLAALRFFQALGGCAQMVVARAVVRDLFEERRAARVFSALILVMGIAPIVAPVIGGWLVVGFGWRSIFWVQAGAALLVLLAVSQFLDESLPEERRRRRSVGEILSVYRELFKHRLFMANTVSGSLASASLFAYIGGSPFVFMEYFGVSEAHFGYFFGANAFGLVIAAQFNGAISDRIDPRRSVRVAMFVATAAMFVLLPITLLKIGGFYLFLVPLFVFIASLGFILPSTTALALAPHGENAGSASAVYGFLQFLLSGIGAFIVSSVHDDTARPMVAAIAVCITASLLINLIFGESARA
ncbi:Bcr/CflA family multidrug efflux MFS transporter [Bradymonas sediminis]|nr:Bcr/CflA family multidrug efflux MFS transporter [Bradymonas sediminis]TDP73866.1 DHA1 family bicyclomycin/chloramphenicol resistance-like MFS transporter [Bradymonas sediminis]